MIRSYYVYILTNVNNNVLYVGMTNNLIRRLDEHRNKVNKGFTYRYNVTKLVYYEIYSKPYDAILREKQLKNWHREWKYNQIRSFNPKMLDLYDEVLGIESEINSD